METLGLDTVPDCYIRPALILAHCGELDAVAVRGATS